ncbi:MAG: hypothetical protein AUK31_07505 [Fibrobacteres bacterium CG2_30_45_31]|nr:MAG: hypothetical protein AUK31_07505 [Fibrobacteres bacterium CG2_30_45_31]
MQVKSLLQARLVLSLTLTLLVGCGNDSSENADPEISSSSNVELSSGVILNSSSSKITGDSSSSSSSISSSSGIQGSSSSGEVLPQVKWVGNSALVITEIATVNLTWLDDQGEDPGWIEIYNAGSEYANLNGYSLVENLGTPRKWVFGDELIPPKGFRTVFCSNRNLTVAPAGTDTDSTHYRTHTNWKLEKDGGAVYLIDPNWSIRDSVRYPMLPTGTSWGIMNRGTWKYFGTPTPEKKNIESTAFDGIGPTVTFGSTQAAGFYKNPITLEIPTASSGATVRCTFDGSVPTSSTSKMASPYYIDSNTVVRCAAFLAGYLSGSVTTNTFFIGESVSLPVVAISVNPDSMFDSNIGMYEFGAGLGEYCAEPCEAANFWKDEELPAHVEFFENANVGTKKGFEIDAGISIMGAWSRYNLKKSVSISMREQYQDGRLNYKLFPDYPELKKFKGFVLRNNGNRFGFDYFEDAMGSSLLKGTGIDYQKSRQVVVFYNGEYYGIHDMREKLNEHFVETNYGIDANTVDFVTHEGAIVTASGGSTAGYESLLQYAATTDLSIAANYTTIQTMMDVGNFADYMAAEIYYQNTDWPNNNVRAWRKNSPESQWKWVVFDLDHGFGFDWSNACKAEGQLAGCYNYNMFDYIASYASKAQYLGKMFTQLLINKNFQRLFINHSAVMLSYYFEPTRVVAAIEKKASEIPASEVTRDLKKFPSFGGGYGLLRKDYISTSGSHMITFANNRIPVVRDDYREKFDLGDDISVTIGASGNGTVKVDGMTLPTTKFTGEFFSGHPIQLLAVASSSGSFVKWEDGSTENPRLVSPTADVTYTATFK